VGFDPRPGQAARLRAKYGLAGPFALFAGRLEEGKGLPLIVEYFRDRGVDVMWTSAGQGDGSPVTFYERYGFTRTGDLHGDEILLRLEIA